MEQITDKLDSEKLESTITTEKTQTAESKVDLDPITAEVVITPNVATSQTESLDSAQLYNVLTKIALEIDHIFQLLEPKTTKAKK